jgi:DNA transformation protein
LRPGFKTRPSGLVAHILDVLSQLGPVDCGRFFGGWSLRVHGVQFAMVMRDELYLSVDDSLRQELIAAGCSPFSYSKAGRRVVTAKLYAAPGGCLDDPDELRFWAAKAMRLVSDTSSPP